MSFVKQSLLVAGVMLLSACSGSGDDVSEDKVLSSENKLKVTAEVVGAGASLQTHEQQVEQGKSASFTLSIQSGYQVTQIQGCNAQLNTQGKVLASNIQHSCHIKIYTQVTNTQANNITVTSLIAGYGRLVGVPETVEQGQSFTVTAEPQTDQKLTDLTGCAGERLGDTLTVKNLSASCEITAKFESQYAQPTLLPERIRLPVVVHVMENGQFTLSDEQIRSQIVATNEHFRAMNRQELSTLSQEHQRVAADTGIQFYLATTAPDGSETSGVNRVVVGDGMGPASPGLANSNKGGIDAWDTTRYINIWVGEDRDRHGKIVLLGQSFIPGDAPDNEIGIAVEYGVFGTLGKLADGYTQGKTVSHELGHFFGLIGHINEGAEDGHRFLPCADQFIVSNCINSELQENFMRARVRDAQLKFFSISQANLMRSSLYKGALHALYQNNLTRQ
ncbi:M43 family zinc metalloprotease [Pseudoalteromonas byunsanensis]|uniref:Peptidase M43 pregnancy-associated plasma-A domain-containing protein n=1 Tax=Pseudoalteromonas byunsanensis TaxID=327939 RepID=A0A1S1MZX6_9GAMM|nr:M43 family zinc metalloprotease [Pseudoalteromonas byunsanensis]OHU94493.1 hypothetical protein BIW53_15595 [Pseudoalteromonas byunsanensis]